LILPSHFFTFHFKGVVRDFKGLETLKISQNEIEVPFILSIHSLLNINNIVFESRSRVPGQTPVVMPRFVAHEKYVIWGLTAMILMHFFKLVGFSVPSPPKNLSVINESEQEATKTGIMDIK
jgi:hypothetical protein